MESRDELMGELALIERQFQASDEPSVDLIEALLAVARALKMSVDERRTDTHLFLDGAKEVESATWAQCGDLVRALSEGKVLDERVFATRVARRIFELTPTHY
ncbi:MAG TPA: hypothetical protein VFK05_07315 [Polyangiaceae bacterium]|nr:hypothetical protein [Polyangiaceae bacterium]